MHIEPVKATFGAVVTEVQLAGMSDLEFTELYDHWLDHALLIFPGQHLSKVEQIEFARRFGALEIDYTPISNVTKEGRVRGDDDVMRVLKGNMDWHCDSTYMPVMAKGAVFSAKQVTESGGETGWADMRAAYDHLPEALKQQISHLSAHHSLHYSQSKVGHTHNEDSDYSGYGFHEGEAPLRPLVKRHPETGRLSLLIGRHAFAIPGMSETESEKLLQDLVTQACCEDRIYYHRWQAGDIVIWDNRCLLHRACGWDLSQPRVMFHSRIAGDSLTEGISQA